MPFVNNLMQLEIITPNGAEPLQEIKQIDLPAVTGRLTLLPGHQPLVCPLEPGKVMIETITGQTSRHTGPGTLMVHGDHVTLLVKSAQA